MKHIKEYQEYKESLTELRSDMISGTSGRRIDSLEDKKYELKKDAKGATIGSFSNVTLPKGTIIYNLPGGVFADHFSLKNKYASKSSQGPQYFDKPTFKGIMIKQTPALLSYIEKNSKVLESVNEAKDNLYLQLHKKYADQIKGLKAKKIKKLTDLVSVQRWAMEDEHGTPGHDHKKMSAVFNNERKLFKQYMAGDHSVMLPESLTEANRGKVFKAARKGSYPAVIVVVQDGKVIHQEPVSTPDIAPATFNVMQEKYPKALLHLEDKTGKRLFSESVNEAEKAEGDRSKMSDEIEKALKDKATESGVPIGLLRLVMRRGLDAWNSSHRAGIPQVAWGYARVNAFLEKGKGTWGKADADIAKEVRDEGKAGKLPIKNPSEFTKKEREA